jgi:putative endonuclease
MTNYKSGLFAEFVARWYLRLRGFQIIKSRYITGRHTNRAEIDIIARRGNLIVFVEVKNRKSAEIAFDAISYTQIVRLRRAAETWLVRMGWCGDARFDVIVVSKYRVQWFKNAF